MWLEMPLESHLVVIYNNNISLPTAYQVFCFVLTFNRSFYHSFDIDHNQRPCRFLHPRGTQAMLCGHYTTTQRSARPPVRLRPWMILSIPPPRASFSVPAGTCPDTGCSSLSIQCAFFTCIHSFYPSVDIQQKNSVRADSSILEEIQILWSQNLRHRHTINDIILQ